MPQLTEAERAQIISGLFTAFTPQQLTDMLACLQVIRDTGGFGTFSLTIKYNQLDEAKAVAKTKSGSEVTVTKKGKSSAETWIDETKKRTTGQPDSLHTRPT